MVLAVGFYNQVFQRLLILANGGGKLNQTMGPVEQHSLGSEHTLRTRPLLSAWLFDYRILLAYRRAQRNR
jgi:hypothetical protein